MLIKLVLPAFSRDVHAGTIVRWHVEEGQTVGFGQDLFDLLVSSRVKMTRPADPRFVLESKSNEPMYATRPTETYFRVVSADVGVVREIRVRADHELTVGAVAALLSTDGGAVTDSETETLEELPEMRVAVNLLEEDAGA